MSSYLWRMTVRETLRYAAFLRLPGKMDSTEIEAKVIIIEQRFRQCFCVYYIRYNEELFMAHGV
jgi:hypothetical protein